MSTQTNPQCRPIDPAVAALVSDEILRDRVRSEIKKDQLGGWFRRFVEYPLGSILVSFVLLIVIGGLFTWCLQNLADNRERKAELRESRHSGAEKVFRDVSVLLDRRLYTTRRYHLAQMNRLDPIALKPYRAQMDSAITDWNNSMTTNASLLCVYFGRDLEKFFTENLNASFRVYSNALKLPDPRNTREGIESLYVRLQKGVYAYNMRLAERIRTGEVVRDETGTGCTWARLVTEAQVVPSDTGRGTYDLP